MTPAWRPDGAAIVAAAAPDEQTFNLVEFAARRLARAPADAHDRRRARGRTSRRTARRSSSSATRRTATTSSRCRIRPTRTTSVQADRRAASSARAATEADGSRTRTRLALPTTDYSPFDTLAPTSWTPVVETTGDQVRVGAGVTGVDVLGYHAYAATRDVAASRARPARRRPAPATPDWQRLLRLRPLASDVLSSRRRARRRSSPARRPTPARRRRPRAASGSSKAGVIFPIRHARVAARRAAVDRPRRRTTTRWRDGAFTRDRTPIRAAWQTITARTYGYSISRGGRHRRRRHGGARPPRARIVRRRDDHHRRRSAPTCPGSRRITSSPSALGGGASTGDADGRPHVPARRRLRPATGVVDFGSDAFSLLRGFAPNTLRRQPRRASPTSSTAGRSRGRSAASARGRSSCTRCTPPSSPTPATRGRARFRARRDQDVGRRASSPRTSSPASSLPFTATVGAALGTRRQRHASPIASPAYFRVGKAF